LPTMPFPKDWDDVMGGTFNLDSIKNLLGFYNQTVAESATLPQLQVQVLEYIGATVTALLSPAEQRTSFFFDNLDTMINPALIDTSAFEDNQDRQLFFTPVPF